MSYYKIKVKSKGTDKKTGDVSSEVSVFQYRNKVRTNLHPGAFLEFNKLLAEVFLRVIQPDPSPMYYYELVDASQGDLCTRIDLGLAAVLDYMVNEAQKITGDTNE